MDKKTISESGKKISREKVPKCENEESDVVTIDWILSIIKMYYSFIYVLFISLCHKRKRKVN